MAIKFENDEIIFSSGTRVYCFSGIVGMPSEGFGLSYGYDGGLDTLSKEDGVELAIEMIHRWRDYWEYCQQEKGA